MKPSHNVYIDENIHIRERFDVTRLIDIYHYVLARVHQKLHHACTYMYM